MATNLSNVSDSTVRTFIAVELPAEIRRTAESISKHLQPYGPMLKIVDPDLMHITVRFLGNVPAAKIAAISTATEDAASGVAPVRLVLSRVGAFPQRGAVPRVIWIGLEDDSGYAVLQKLAAALETSLAGIGFPRERRPFAPHLTLARVREGVASSDGRRLGELVRRLQTGVGPYGSFDVEQLSIMRSDLGPHGPKYTALAHVRLGTRAGSDQ